MYNELANEQMMERAERIDPPANQPTNRQKEIKFNLAWSGKQLLNLLDVRIHVWVTNDFKNEKKTIGKIENQRKNC